MENNNNKHEIEIDIKQIFGLLLSKALYIGIVSAVCAILAFSYFQFMATEKYTSIFSFNASNSLCNCSFS